MRVLVTGGTSGFGKELVDYFDPLSEGIGRGNGWTLSDPGVYKSVSKKSLNFDIFINFAFIRGDIQLNILQSVFEKWTFECKKGLIINFGSINTYYKMNKISTYAIQKSSLDEACRQMSKMGISGQTSARVTNLRPGYLNMKKNAGKPFYQGFGVSARQIGQIIQMLFNEDRLIYPEVIVDTKQLQNQ